MNRDKDLDQTKRAMPKNVNNAHFALEKSGMLNVLTGELGVSGLYSTSTSAAHCYMFRPDPTASFRVNHYLRFRQWF